MASDWEVTLPWPSSVLSPNGRHHWTAVADAKKRYRQVCHLLSLQAGAGFISSPLEQEVAAGRRISVHCDFYPPDRRNHDDANCMARMKAGIDGLADAIGIDDKHFKTSYDLKREIGGMVKVRVSVESQ